MGGMNLRFSWEIHDYGGKYSVSAKNAVTGFQRAIVRDGPKTKEDYRKAKRELRDWFEATGK